MRAELHQQYGNPYPVETAIFQLDGENLAAEVTRSLFHRARSMPRFSASLRGCDFRVGAGRRIAGRLPDGGIAIGTRQPITCERIAPPSSGIDCPRQSALSTAPDHSRSEQSAQSVLQGGGHQRIASALIHEFVRSIIEQRKPAIDSVTAANWSAAGICAICRDEGRDAVEIPSFA